MSTRSATMTPALITERPLSRRRRASTVGILFVVQMVTAMIGTSLIQAFVDGDPDRATHDARRPADDVLRPRRGRHRSAHVSRS